MENEDLLKEAGDLFEENISDFRSHVEESENFKKYCKESEKWGNVRFALYMILNFGAILLLQNFIQGWTLMAVGIPVSLLLSTIVFLPSILKIKSHSNRSLVLGKRMDERSKRIKELLNKVTQENKNGK